MLIFLLKNLAWIIIRSLTLTYKVSIFKLENKRLAESMNPKGSYIFALWHETVLGVMYAHAWKKPYLALASRSKDGEIAAYISKKMGFTSVRGSSRKKGKDKGGKEAMQIYVDALSQGLSGGLTIDGPKGPRRICKPGAVLIARDGGCAVIPTAAYYHACWEFSKTWDKLKIPKPFSRIDVSYGEPVFISSQASPEEIQHACNLIGDRINLEEDLLRDRATKKGEIFANT